MAFSHVMIEGNDVWGAVGVKVVHIENQLWTISEDGKPQYRMYQLENEPCIENAQWIEIHFWSTNRGVNRALDCVRVHGSNSSFPMKLEEKVQRHIFCLYSHKVYQMPLD